MFFECIAWVVPEILVVSEPVVSGRDAQVKIETVETVKLKDISVRDTQSANVALASGASEFHIVFAVKSIQSPVGTLKRTVVTHVHTYFRRHGGHVVTVAFGFAVFQPAISSFHSNGVSAAQIGFQFNVGGDKSSPGGEIGLMAINGGSHRQGSGSCTTGFCGVRFTVSTSTTFISSFTTGGATTGTILSNCTLLALLNLG